MIDYVDAIRENSRRFLELIDSVPPDAAVPSCPGWTVADLTWHLTEVQHTWGHIVAGLITDRTAVPDLHRPDAESLVDLFRDTSAALVNALVRRDPADACWSWHEAGRSVGWVQRRQAHEALIHRVDAELAAGSNLMELDPVLAADGVDEVLSLFLDASDLPEWAAFVTTGETVAINLADPPTTWHLELGRFSGTSPNSGTTYDEEAVRLVPARAVETTVRGTAEDVDRWLWGRGSLDALSISGDPAGAALVRSAAAHATQ